MTPQSLRRFMMGKEGPHETLEFLGEQFIPAAVGALNSFTRQRRIALYPGERVPTNERNLTDVRTRMGQLLEYLFVEVANESLVDQGVSDLTWTHVVAHRFPDLEMRDSGGVGGLRLEVKCLQSIAEEKAANFDTLLKDIHPQTDYVVVLLWEWFAERPLGGWESAPKVVAGFVFHAHSLAQLRDFRWLQHPPSSAGDSLQGFDLRYAVNSRSGSYSVEEGNYGKLLRIWKHGLGAPPDASALLRNTIKAFLDFEEAAVWNGFRAVAWGLLVPAIGTKMTPISAGGREVGYRTAGVACFCNRRVDASLRREIATALQLHHVVTLGDKYRWVLQRSTNGNLRILRRGKKPKSLHLDQIGN